MKLNTDMRYHDLRPRMGMEKLFTRARGHDIRQIQLALGESISDRDFTTGHYSSGFAQAIARELERNQVHMAVLGCYISPINPIGSRRQTGAVHFIEHMRYTRIIEADMVGTETGHPDLDPRVTEEPYTGGAHRLLPKNMREAVAAAEKLGAIIRAEGIFNHALYSPARMKRFLESIDSPNVGTVLDAIDLIHPYQVEPEAQKQVIDRASVYYGDHTEAFHVKDFIFDGWEQLFCRVGGSLSWCEPFIKHVKERKSHITILLKNFSRERHHEDVKFLQQIYDRMQRTV